jgi:excinuclease ABC subunit C
MQEITFSQELLDKITQVPTSPGIYQYKNIQGKIIYVGKAKNLRNRVKSYFTSINSRDAKTKVLVQKIADIEVIIVDSEAEALILEDNLIKKFKPKYNIMLRDDKTYPFIRITNEEFPRIFLTRNIIKDGSKYFGPFTDVRSIKYLLNFVRNIFQIRSCKLNLIQEAIFKNKFRSCLDFHIGKCQAPCISNITKAEYSNNVKMAIQVLFGKTKLLAAELENSMNKFSDNLEFEKAAVVRNQLKSLSEFSAKQKIVSTELTDKDIFGIARFGDFACTLIFNIREGKLIGKRHFLISKAELETNDEILQRTIEKYYLDSEFIPKEILLNNEIRDLDYILDWLGKKRGSSISVQFPKIGDKRKLVEMANTNAEFLLKEFILSLEKRDKIIPHSIVALQRDLHLPKLPRRIECYDNSHIQGSDMVSSMVVFIDGKPKKSEYRKFKAKWNSEDFSTNNENTDDILAKNNLHNDDFATMRETIYRRFHRAVAENQELPDLVVVDGGKGQLSSAFGILQELGIAEKVQIIGLAKRLEEIFFPNNSDSILLPKTSSSLKLIMQLRDEAHRFAITFHRQLRDKRLVKSELEEIEGIGKQTINKLLIKFGSVKGIKAAKAEELEEILNKTQFKKLKEYFLIENID